MHDNLNKRILVSRNVSPTGAAGPVDFNATGDKLILTPAVPVDIMRFGFITNSSMDPDAGGFVIALDHRPTAGSDSGRTEKDSITRVDADVLAAGKLVYKDVDLEDLDGETAEDGTLRNVGPVGPVRVAPGEEAVVEVTNAVGAASTGYIFLEYIEHGFNISASNVIEDLV